MGSNQFSALEIDAVGEILNISLGASATAVSTMLNTRVDITTPVVKVVRKDEFEMDRVEPAVGVEITYISGLEGSNVMLLKRHDVKVIVEMLMGISVTDEEFELNELNISAVCEVMNQMMGASSTALSEFLGKMVNISTPVSFEVANEQEFIDKYFDNEEYKVVVGFSLKIGDQMESEFFNVMPICLAKSLVKGFLPDDVIIGEGEEQESGASQAEPPKTVPDAVVSEPQPSAAQTPDMSMMQPQPGAVQPQMPDMSMMQPQPGAVQPQMPDMSMMQPQPGAVQPQMPDMSMMSMQMQMMQQMMQQMQQMQQQMGEKQKPAEPKLINVQPVARQNLKQDGGVVLQEEQEENMELIMGVPLEISVEIGRTRKLVRDILDFTKGSLVILDKLAGEQVDLFVNGQCIAKGEVVVVEDNFGIRITEITRLNLAALE
ncbi:flagellar motor switch protein FliN [Mediterraneibacter agrestimuris]|uniref:flagellar motor switch protein FliN n=1 Tax=Mediterraneibacter agrestimuris TaxID=2941333 RepID=UPI00203BF92F|nr:flagellar motor switch protein FliN [Mediterraneibacter agrestimuris]